MKHDVLLKCDSSMRFQDLSDGTLAPSPMNSRILGELALPLAGTQRVSVCFRPAGAH